ncbi:unnamed protein product [Vitrella brassicaformis CCMP3155]|uniref:Peptidase M10 serralysin C-terminal domain-containing protein n=1 Tax=Vitrella brassicaformis (strain CCMP3155) TaxID=1169540 RepID=A0A0G4H2W8_VITBC|nr:unnamed protein product [Vitrella brassicaformis CCMP3155]|eukprot:CEM37901.1 unnamed protein product [Vitrella brassicaformis CCMP3155]
MDARGVFLYTNVKTKDSLDFTGGLNLNRLVFSEDLASDTTPLKVLARDVSTCSEGADAAIVAGRCNENAENIQAAIADAEKYVKDNFVFGDVVINLAVFGATPGTPLSDIFLGQDDDDKFVPGANKDFIETRGGKDQIFYSGVDIDDGALEDSIFDFSFTDDTIFLDGGDFNVDALIFLAIQLFGPNGVEDFTGNKTDLAAIRPDTTFWVLLNTDNGQFGPDEIFNARAAAMQISGVLDAINAFPGAGFLIYFNEGLQLTRLVYTPNLRDGNAPLSVLARFVDKKGRAARDALFSWNAGNFLLGGSNTDFL